MRFPANSIAAITACTSRVFLVFFIVFQSTSDARDSLHHGEEKTRCVLEAWAFLSQGSPVHTKRPPIFRPKSNDPTKIMEIYLKYSIRLLPCQAARTTPSGTAPDPRGVPSLGKGPGTDKAPAGVNSNQRGRSARSDPSTCLFPGAGIWCYCTYAWITWAATVPREEPDPPCSTTTARAISGSS